MPGPKLQNAATPKTSSSYPQFRGRFLLPDQNSSITVKRGFSLSDALWLMGNIVPDDTPYAAAYFLRGFSTVQSGKTYPVLLVRS